MKDRIALLLYAAAVIAGTLVHDPGLMALALALVLAGAGRHRRRIVHKAALTVAPFNVVVSVSYLLFGAIAGTVSVQYLVLMNLRVLFLTCLGFLFAARANPFRALSFSPGLARLFTLAYGQALTLSQVLSNFRFALESRRIQRAGLRDRYLASAAVGATLMDKALHNATEISLVMRSRGFSHD